MPQPSALQNYRSTHYETGSPEKLIVELYEGAVRFCQEAKEHIDRGEIGQKGNAIQRASRIVHELDAALNHEVGGDIAANLSALYDFVDFKLTEANLQNDARHLDDVIGVLNVLLASWRRVASGEIPAQDLPTPEAPPKKAETNASSILSISV